MQENLVRGLLATLYGMAGVFLVLILFYGVARLLLWAALKRPPKEEP
ncbi:oxaloacetate decarboxylase gamma subunit [Hydrogenispora ethanolica]|jgi:Na+-transporting methylmalonyl-CoA/oxaloacetate decarboxylase gamma subunit|uniref:Oxaloacetate decarboxylase gamma subunit n=1 Tax=Hydrogenispora ethanolica TaxID=1082276 RepID=A0A4R1R9Z1_HYDET|nr:OadG family protein [Hydrogenispora ethanolica]TCL62429.1 oxaloacetate decarboxylase gamma subunit [Hydrogenispora ethanolica]